MAEEFWLGLCNDLLLGDHVQEGSRTLPSFCRHIRGYLWIDARSGAANDVTQRAVPLWLRTGASGSPYNPLRASRDQQTVNPAASMKTAFFSVKQLLWVSDFILALKSKVKTESHYNYYNHYNVDLWTLNTAEL